VQEPALAVVGEHDGVGLAHAALVLVELRRQDLMAGGALEIDAQELLLVADDAELHRGRKRRVAMQRAIHLLRATSLFQRVARLVIATTERRVAVALERR
jgi:hypothetical protein